jgi:hypothetical protein
MRTRVGVLALLFVLGCTSTHSSTYRSQSSFTQITANISVAWGAPGPSDEVRFDDPRLQRAVSETAAIVGHPVQFRFDLSLMPRPMGRFFDFFFENYVGRVPRDLERLARRDADIFAFGRERLRAIHFDYDGSVIHPALAFDPESGVLRIQMNGQSELVSHGAVSGALDRAFWAYLEATYRDADVARIAPEHYRLYLRYLDRANGDREVRAAALSSAIAVYERARGGPPDLRQAAIDVIVDHADMLSYERIRYTREVEALPASSRFRIAEQDFARFVQQAWGEIGERAQLTLLRAMLERSSGPEREDDPYRRDLYPGVDVLALGLGVMDRWLAAGRPNPLRVEREDHTLALYNFVVCAPVAREHRDYDTNGCYGEVYHYASTHPTLRPRLLDEVIARQSTELTEALFANLASIQSPHMLDAWRHFERDPAQWAIATRVIAELGDYNRGYELNELYDDSARIWRQQAGFRGSLLYVLAAREYPGNYRIVNWAEFSRVFGSLASRQDVDSFLANGNGALIRIATIVPAIAPRVDIVGALIPHLDRAMDDERLRRRYHFFPYEVLRNLVTALRARNDTANIAALRRYFEGRMTGHPSEQRWLETLIQMTTR